jgi:hypothetical protein
VRPGIACNADTCSTSKVVASGDSLWLQRCMLGLDYGTAAYFQTFCLLLLLQYAALPFSPSHHCKGVPAEVDVAVISQLGRAHIAAPVAVAITRAGLCIAGAGVCGHGVRVGRGGARHSVSHEASSCLSHVVAGHISSTRHTSKCTAASTRREGVSCPDKARSCIACNQAIAVLLLQGALNCWHSKIPYSPTIWMMMERLGSRQAVVRSNPMPRAFSVCEGTHLTS